MSANDGPLVVQSVVPRAQCTGAGGALTLTNLLNGGLQVAIRFFDCEH